MTSTPQRVAIITGGSRGIGRQVAVRLTAQGYAVVVNYAGNKANADAFVETLTADGGTAIAVRADVADEEAVAGLFDIAEREFGGIDVVVHAAGVLLGGPLVDLDLDVLDRILRTNLRGTFVVDQQAARRVRPGGAIINFSSSVTRFAWPGSMAYTATKAGVEAITLILARELRGRDITVNAVAPGAVETEMFEQYVKEGGEQVRTQMAESSPMGRVGTPDDIAEAVVFLAGPARWINGQVLYANGGAI